MMTTDAETPTDIEDISLQIEKQTTENFDNKLSLCNNMRKLTALFAYLSALLSFTLSIFLTLPGISYGASPMLNDEDNCFDDSYYLIIYCILWYFHFLRRLYETFFVFKYHTIAALWEVFFGVFYYGILGFWCGWTVNLNTFHTYGYPKCALIFVGLFIYIIGEFGNCFHHFLLKNMRPKGIKGHVIPNGGFFKFVSAPHYFFELVSWFGAFIASSFGTGFIVMFLISLVTLYGLAKQKHNALKAEFHGFNETQLYPP
eukprot:215450_1